MGRTNVYHYMLLKYDTKYSNKQKICNTLLNISGRNDDSPYVTIHNALRYKTYSR